MTAAELRRNAEKVIAILQENDKPVHSIWLEINLSLTMDEVGEVIEYINLDNEVILIDYYEYSIKR